LCFGEVSGVGVGVDFFFRCLRVGVGEGSKVFLIFVANDCSAASAQAPDKNAPSKKQQIILLRAIDIIAISVKRQLQASDTDALQFTVLS